ncbi:MAG: sugar phosphate isomerase/epimerase, partial [Cyanobacteria bacterium J06638_22]
AEKRRYPLASQGEYWRQLFAMLPQSRWPGQRYALLEFVEGDKPEAFFQDAATLRSSLGRDNTTGPDLATGAH